MGWPQACPDFVAGGFEHSESKGPVDEMEVALPFLSQSPEVREGPDLASFPCTLRFKGRGHRSPLEGRVARSHYRGMRVRELLQKLLQRHTKTSTNYSSGITLFPLRQASSLQSD